jgi:hypothetical protein
VSACSSAEDLNASIFSAELLLRFSTLFLLQLEDMFLFEVTTFAACVAGVFAAPTLKFEARHAPAGVPDYVLNYGKGFLKDFR